MNVARADLIQLVQSAWVSLLEWDIEEHAPPENTDEFFIGTVAITGAWTGKVLLRCHPALARSLAAAIFGAPEDEVTLDVIQDALGELTNIVGGNLKSLIGKCLLGLPMVLSGSEYSVRMPSGCFSCFRRSTGFRLRTSSQVAGSFSRTGRAGRSVAMNGRHYQK